MGRVMSELVAGITGVEIHGKKLRITFTYKGVRCREVLADPAWRDLDTEDDRYLYLRPLMEIPISHIKLITEHYWKMRDLFT